MFEQLISLYAPLECLGCQAEGALLCDVCQAGLTPTADRCYRCKMLSIDGRTCLPCRRASKLYAVQVVTDYDGLAKQLVGSLKFDGRRAAARLMAQLLSEAINFDGVDMIVPLPTATSRVRQRGYDQAELLAKALVRQLGLPCCNLLARRGQARQVGASRAQRLKQLAGAYELKRPVAVAGQRILLIDDVLTTGASLETAAEVLKTSGAKRVYGVVFARA